MQNLHPLAEAYRSITRVRVCGLLIQDHQLLLARHVAAFGDGSFWMPPGGGLEFGEKVTDCLRREFAEETGLRVDVGRFLYLNEFLQEPLHALELFFEVKPTSGQLALGSDPEHAPDQQLLQEVKFMTVREISSINPQQLHPILHALVNFDDLFIPKHNFLT